MTKPQPACPTSTAIVEINPFEAFVRIYSLKTSKPPFRRFRGVL
jgi:hypothetical protein